MSTTGNRLAGRPAIRAARRPPRDPCRMDGLTSAGRCWVASRRGRVVHCIRAPEQDDSNANADEQTVNCLVGSAPDPPPDAQGPVPGASTRWVLPVMADGGPTRAPGDRAAPDTDGTAALARGVLLIRWPVLGWMLALAVFGIVGGRDPAVAVGAVAVATTWVVWLTLRHGPWTTAALVADLAIAGVLVVAGARSAWLATIYPVTAPLTWGAVRGIRGGLVAGGVLGFVSVVAGLPAAGSVVMWDPATLRDPVYLLLAGGGMGFVAKLLDRSAAQVRAAQAAEVEATERAARLTERESIGRQIHDSVLQSLALVHKRGRELAAQPAVEGARVAQLAELAAAQERTLRQLILRAPGVDRTPTGIASLRDRLEQAVAVCDGSIDVAVSTVGPVDLPTRHVEEVGAAVDQALANVLRHAGARHVWLFAEADGTDVVVTVRDDGAGFTFDEEALRAAGKYGLLRSIRGRIADLGGGVTVDTAPGRGTVLELRVPAPTGVVDQEASARE